MRIGIVGFGFMGKMHCLNWRKIAGTEVVAVQDVAIEEVKKRLNAQGNIAGTAAAINLDRVQLFSDFDKMLAESKLDALSITAPTFLHADLTVRALKAGVHVLCEKPMALTLSECDQMTAAAKCAGKFLQIGHCIRFWPEYVWAKDAVVNQTYGKLRAASFRRLGSLPNWNPDNWFADEQRSGGVALDLHCHDTDFAYSLLGVPRAVFSVMDDGRRHMQTQYVYDTGAAVSAEAGWAMMPTFGFEMSFNIMLERATLQYDSTRQPAFRVCPADGKPFTPDLLPGDGYSREIEHFAAAAGGKSAPQILTPEQSRETIRIVLAEKESAHRKEIVLL
jgi:predicted dehydrogenase